MLEGLFGHWIGVLEFMKVMTTIQNVRYVIFCSPRFCASSYGFQFSLHLIKKCYSIAFACLWGYVGRYNTWSWAVVQIVVLLCMSSRKFSTIEAFNRFLENVQCLIYWPLAFWFSAIYWCFHPGSIDSIAFVGWENYTMILSMVSHQMPFVSSISYFTSLDTHIFLIH